MRVRVCVCVRLSKTGKERQTDRDRAKDSENERERGVAKGRGELWGKPKYIHIVGSVACVYVSALGNWSHKSNSLSEVAVGLLENMKGGESYGGGNREMEGERKRVSVIHTLSLNAISPECQVEM